MAALPGKFDGKFDGGEDCYFHSLVHFYIRCHPSSLMCYLAVYCTVRKNALHSRKVRCSTTLVTFLRKVCCILQRCWSNRNLLLLLGDEHLPLTLTLLVPCSFNNNNAPLSKPKLWPMDQYVEEAPSLPAGTQR